MGTDHEMVTRIFVDVGWWMIKSLALLLAGFALEVMVFVGRSSLGFVCESICESSRSG